MNTRSVILLMIYVGVVLSLCAGPMAARVGAACPGDCGGDGRVTVDELVRGVRIALGLLRAESCPAFDVNGDGAVRVSELIQAVKSALGTCPPLETPTAGPTSSPTPSATPSLVPSATSSPTPSFTPSPTPTVAGILFAGSPGELLPHNLGDSFSYRVTGAEEGLQTFSITRSESDGTFQVNLREGSRREIRILHDDGTAVVLTELTVISERTITTCEPSIVQVSTPLRVGEPIGNASACVVRSQFNNKFLGDFTHTMAVAPTGTLDRFSVEAGTFDGVIRLAGTKTIVSDDGTDNIDVEVFIKSGLGVLRSVETLADGSFRMLELIEATVGNDHIGPRARR